MELIPISEHPDSAKILYDLLAERTPEQSISHREMPSVEEHLAFVALAPYDAWYLIECTVNGQLEIVGSIYLTRANEIGIFIFRQHQGVGFGLLAVPLLMEMHGKRRYVANISPQNDASLRMFDMLGFRTIQHTLALDAD